MKNKPFDRELYEQYNQKGIEAAKHFYKDYCSVDVVEDYGLDLKLFNSDKICTKLVEVEVRAQWIKGKKYFSYPIVHIPARKYKYITKALPLVKELSNIDFIIFNKDCNIAFLSNFDLILKCPLAEVPNIYMPEGEYFYKVPKNYFTYYDLIDNTWTKR